jgi:hypothetical protein
MQHYLPLHNLFLHHCIEKHKSTSFLFELKQVFDTYRSGAMCLPSLGDKELHVFHLVLLGYLLLEPSHQVLRKPNQPVEKPE